MASGLEGIWKGQGFVRMHAHDVRKRMLPEAVLLAFASRPHSEHKRRIAS